MKKISREPSVMPRGLEWSPNGSKGGQMVAEAPMDGQAKGVWWHLSPLVSDDLGQKWDGAHPPDTEG